MFNFSWGIQRKTPIKIGKKNLNLKIEKYPFGPSLKKRSGLDHPKYHKSQPVFYILGIIVLKFQINLNNRTKVIERKPNFLRHRRHANNISHSSRSPNCLDLKKSEKEIIKSYLSFSIIFWTCSSLLSKTYMNPKLPCGYIYRLV